MLLTVDEAATVLGISTRAVRARLARGQLPGRKIDGAWRLPREALPLPAAAHEALQARAEEIREAVDRALPSRGSRRDGRKHRSVLDLLAFRAALELRPHLPETGRAPLDHALLQLSVAFHEYRPEARLAALTEARGALARTVATLLLHDRSAHTITQVDTLEREVLPAMTGLFRRAERRP